MMDNNPRDNHDQQPPYKRQNMARAYTVGPGEKREYAGTLPLCKKCNFTTTWPSGAKASVKTLTCFECGNQGHYKSDCSKMKNQGCGNQSGNSKARGRVYALGGGEANQDPNDDTKYADA
ncbi:reverse transcriptase domain-containing protein [Tanacetum coccineum]